MPQTRIEQLINEIYDFIEECKPSALSQSKIVVPKDQLLDLLDELKRRTPDEIKRYQKIIANRDSIIAQAEERAKEIEEEARARAQALVNETEVMQSAYKQAHEMISSATSDSEKIRTEAEDFSFQVRTGALSYVGDILSQIQNVLATAHKETKDNCDRLISTFEKNLSEITVNRNEVLEQINGNLGSDDSDSDDDFPDDFNFPDGTF